MAFLTGLWRDTGRLPPALARKPTLHPDLVPFWQAFWKLHHSRPVMWGPGPIPLSEILAYAELIGWHEPELRHELMTHIHTLDHTWLTHQQPSRKADDGRHHARDRHQDRPQRRQNRR